MKITKHLFLVFLGVLVIGCASCVPGICGCAFSIWPSSWEQWIDQPALIMDMIGAPGMLICCTLMLIFWTRRKTIDETARIRTEQQANKNQS